MKKREPKAKVIIDGTEYRVYHKINVPGEGMFTPEALVKDKKLLCLLAEQGRNGIETVAVDSAKKSASPSKAAK